MSEDRFRRRVAEIASADGGVLTDAARERILSRVADQGPALVRAARWKRRALYAAGPVLAAAAVFAFVAKTDAVAPKREVVAAAKKQAPSHALACSARPVPAAREFVPASGGSALDLGGVALAVADQGASVRAESVEACRTIIGLTAGRVTVHARDLGGGELSVRAPGALVTVKGTIFSVTQNPDALVVEVAEGTVAVSGRSGEHLVHRGERLHLSAVGIAQGELGGVRENALRAVVGVPAVVGFEALPEGESQTEPSVRAEASAVATAPRAMAQGRPRLAHGQDPAAEKEAPEAAAVEGSVAEAPPPRVELPEAPAKAETAADWLTQAEQARKAGKFAEARTLYRRIAEQGSGVTAEAAWVALARMELSLGHLAAARDATKRRQERFGHGTLEPEALWIDVRTYRQSGDATRARSLAEDLVRRWPKSPQARAAEQWLSSGE